MNDVFANIASEGIGGRAELLVENIPEFTEFKEALLTESTVETIKTKTKIASKEELKKELADMRRKYEPFLENYAPEVKNYRDIIKLKHFELDGKDIELPHFAGPCGYAKQVYKTQFEIINVSKDKSYYICFKGADYKAFVYINEICVGIHEGFFSPFEFNIDEVVREGTNTLKVELYNDYIYMGNASASENIQEGDKMYAATGLGWDDPQVGWHHCPPGMGIYNDVSIEIRKRISIADVFVRENEIWVDVLSEDYESKEITFNISVYGQNFKETVVKDLKYIPETMKTVGMGDSLTQSEIKDSIGKGIRMPAQKGLNTYKIPFNLDNPKRWTLDEPNLYQVQIEVIYNDTVFDQCAKQFGVRTFTQDLESKPKGMFYLNGEKIRLRGANTMGFEQQDVMKNDFEQLIDDILLAKLCNMNFLRFTQRPVQNEVYEYCDKLGIMTQTDLPLFGCMRRTKLAEGIRQAEEMEKIIRNHPCNVIISYINEPFPNARNKPHRHMNRNELNEFFKCCDIAVKMLNPDRVIKHVDGDYDPPSETLPDNHCYPMWYNAHGIDIGLLNKGYWLPTSPDWYYGCGEYGAEGLDYAELMKEQYPKEWMKEPFSPNNIVNAQTGNFYHMFYDKGDSVVDWVEKSQQYQAYATDIMTQAFRRNPKMVTFAIHLFIDAWPAGWMKTIMDCKRNPKPAYFTYRNALEPLNLSIRTDRFTYFEGEKISMECFVCNDTNEQGEYKVVYEVNNLRAESIVEVKPCDVTYVSNPVFVIDKVNDREKFTVKAILIKGGQAITYTTQEIEVFEKKETISETKNEIILNLQPGEYEIAGEKVTVKSCSMLPVHFVSRKTGHKSVEEFTEKDFSYWYDKKKDMITPILYNTFEADGFTPILTSGNKDENGIWKEVLACAEKEYHGKKYIICNVELRCENPVAQRFLNNIKLSK